MNIRIFGKVYSVDLQKASRIKSPGSRGGKYYVDKNGNVVYGERPMGRSKTGKAGNVVDTAQKQAEKLSKKIILNSPIKTDKGESVLTIKTAMDDFLIIKKTSKYTSGVLKNKTTESEIKIPIKNIKYNENVVLLSDDDVMKHELWAEAVGGSDKDLEKEYTKKPIKQLSEKLRKQNKNDPKKTKPWEMTKNEWENFNGEIFYVNEDYDPKHRLYLRFTKMPHQDIINKYSRWFEHGMTKELADQEGFLYDKKYDTYYKNHAGLSGHELNAENLKEALAEIKNKKGLFGDVSTDDFAIFEETGKTVEQDTPEGNTFDAGKVLYFKKTGNLVGSGTYKEEHKAAIRRAINDGENVPEMVLKQYSEFKKR